MCPDRFSVKDLNSLNLLRIFSDSLHPEMIEQLMASLTKIPYTREAFKTAIQNAASELPMIEDYLNEFEEWIVKEIS